jgi:hypothetical protein
MKRYVKKNQSVQEETFANTLTLQDIVEETVSFAQQTNLARAKRE